MKKIKSDWRYLVIIALILLIVSSFCLQSTFAYFTDKDTIGSNSVNVPYITKTVKINDSEIQPVNNFYSTTTQAGNNEVTIQVTSNIPVVLRMLGPLNVTYNSNFTLSEDGYYYYNELVNNSVSNISITLFTKSSAQAEDISFVVDIVQGNYYGLGAMIGYVYDSTGEQSIVYDSIDYENKTINYNISKSELGNSFVIVGYGKALETVTSSKTILITAYESITFTIILNITA